MKRLVSKITTIYQSLRRWKITWKFVFSEGDQKVFGWKRDLTNYLLKYLFEMDLYKKLLQTVN